MKVVVKDRMNAKRDSYKVLAKSTAIISIYSSDDTPVIFAINPNLKYVLSVMFDDIETDEEVGILMTKENAKDISTFVHRCVDKDIEEIWVHCDAGISRSAGVAAAILKFLMNDDTQIFDNPKYAPNMKCYRLTLNELMRQTS